MKIDFPSKKEIFQKLKEFIKEDTKILLGVSGGADSMLMFFVVRDFFEQNNFDIKNIFIAHYNHKFRSQSDQEQTQLKDLFSSKYIDFRTSEYTGTNFTENALRKARYEFFALTMSDTKADFLLIGHNLDDRIETSLLNMLRGCTLQGFLNMDFHDTKILDNTKINILRPLISLPKYQIKDLCHKYDIAYFEDATNIDTKISKRNFIRKNIIATLVDQSNKTKDGKIKFYQSFARIYQDYVSDQSQTSFKYVSMKLSKYWGAEFGYQVNGKFEISNLVVLLKQAGGYTNISKNNLQEIIDFWDKGKQGYKYFNGVYFWLCHGQRYIIKAPKDFWQKTIEDKLQIANIGEYRIGDFVFKSSESDIGSILRFVKPLDLYKSKKINKAMINKKIPIFWRNFIVVHEKDGKIIKILEIK